MQQAFCANSDLSHSLPMVTVGGDAYIAPRANVGIGPYGLYRRCTTNRNLKTEGNHMELDKDLLARQEARQLLRQAEIAQKQLATFPQEKLDAIVNAISDAIYGAAPELAELAVRETGFGNTEDKITKNQFASRTLWQAIKDMKTVGVLKEHPAEKLWEVGVPVGVIAAIVPSTNPTSTVCYKALIALKAGNHTGNKTDLVENFQKWCVSWFFRR